MFDIDKSIKKIIGKGKKIGGKNDWDGDGVLNKFDCQPRNTMRQDEINYRRGPYRNRKMGYDWQGNPYPYSEGTSQIPGVDLNEFVMAINQVRQTGNPEAFEQAEKWFNKNQEKLGNLAPTYKDILDKARFFVIEK